MFKRLKLTANRIRFEDFINQLFHLEWLMLSRVARSGFNEEENEILDEIAGQVLEKGFFSDNLPHDKRRKSRFKQKVLQYLENEDQDLAERKLEELLVHPSDPEHIKTLKKTLNRLRKQGSNVKDPNIIRLLLNRYEEYFERYYNAKELKFAARIRKWLDPIYQYNNDLESLMRSIKSALYFHEEKNRKQYISQVKEVLKDGRITSGNYFRFASVLRSLYFSDGDMNNGLAVVREMEDKLLDGFGYSRYNVEMVVGNYCGYLLQHYFPRLRHYYDEQKLRQIPAKGLTDEFRPIFLLNMTIGIMSEKDFKRAGDVIEHAAGLIRFHKNERLKLRLQEVRVELLLAKGKADEAEKFYRVKDHFLQDDGFEEKWGVHLDQKVRILLAKEAYGELLDILERKQTLKRLEALQKRKYPLLYVETGLGIARCITGSAEPEIFYRAFYEKARQFLERPCYMFYNKIYNCINLMREHLNLQPDHIRGLEALERDMRESLTQNQRRLIQAIIPLERIPVPYRKQAENYLPQVFRHIN